MATSGSKNFEPDVGEFIEEAFERCGIELRTGYDLKTAQRSLNLLLAEWSNRGLNQWTVNQKTVAMVADTTVYDVDTTNATAAIDVLDAFIRERAEYSSYPSKSTTGKPNQFMVDKQLSPTITVFPAPDKSSTYTIYMNVLTRMDDADVGSNTMQMPYRFYPCLAAGLAYYISLKKAPERTGMLKQLYEEEFLRAMTQDEERASFRVSPDLRGYNTP